MAGGAPGGGTLLAGRGESAVAGALLALLLVAAAPTGTAATPRVVLKPDPADWPLFPSPPPPSPPGPTRRAAGSAGGADPLAGYLLSEEVERPVDRANSASPCVVTLLRNQSYASYPGIVPVSYSPNPSCGRSWRQVILRLEMNVNGVQFDRRFTFILDGMPLLLSTTSEPLGRGVKSALERDITSHSSFLLRKRTGTAQLANIVNDKYTGIFYVNLELLFFPGNFPSDTPNLVVPVSGNMGVLPRNIVRARVEVAVGHFQSDEFFYLTVPDSYYSSLSPEMQRALPLNGGTPFKEVVLSLDGNPITALLNLPVLHSGAFDPALWFPFVGIGAHKFPTYSLDITPLASVLADGRRHSLTFSVPSNATGSLWVAMGSLHLWLDRRASSTAGRVTKYQFTRPIIREVIAGRGSLEASMTTSTNHTFLTTGTMRTSHGTITTRVLTYLEFRNSVALQNAAAKIRCDHYIKMVTSVLQLNGSRVLSNSTTTAEAPLTVVLESVKLPNGRFVQTAAVTHEWNVETIAIDRGVRSIQNLENYQDVMSTIGAVWGNTTSLVYRSNQDYLHFSSAAKCYRRQVQTRFAPRETGLVKLRDDARTTLSC